MSEMSRCPFCDFQEGEEYAMLLHIEKLHSEGKSPFIVDEKEDEDPRSAADNVSNDEEERMFAECPIDGCGEVITLAELEDHIELHAAEEPSSVAGNIDGAHLSRLEENDPPRPRRDHGSDATAEPAYYQRNAESIAKWKRILHMPLSSSTRRQPLEASSGLAGENSKRRLGKAELGRYAHEDKMPEKLVALLRKGRYISSEGIIPVVEQLLQQSPTTHYAYLCHPCVQHISKLRREGGFCGYRNIQMLTSYIVGTGIPGTERFHNRIPSIFRIQDYIESAWDMGINAHGRVETGGVRGTRKYIGTSEAQAVLTSLQIQCEVQAFKSPQPRVAETALFEAIERYFQSADHDSREKVRLTSLPPIYFQHRGHSLTIFGLEKRTDGMTELLVFDPMFRDPDTIAENVGRKIRHRNPDHALKLYRRGSKYLRKYHEFEILRLGGKESYDTAPKMEN